MQTQDSGHSFIKDQPKIIRSWAFFDWANSVYSLVITSTIFPVYYSKITANAGADGHSYVTFLGRKFINTALYDYSMAFAFLVIACISPILSSIADARGNKKSFLKFFTTLGAVSCGLLYFFTADTVQLSIVIFVMAAIGFWGSLVFYNAFLPEIASPENQDRVSAKGFTYGYIGSVILQFICFVFVFKPDWFGITDAAMPARISFLLVGLWWIGFAQIPFKYLPNVAPIIKDKKAQILTAGFKELAKVWNYVKSHKSLKYYLFSFFFFSIGVQTVMLVATIFGEKELDLSTEKLIATILILQLLAIVGAALMAYLSRKFFGNLGVLIGMIIVWVLVCIAAYSITTEIQFYLLAAVVGLMMGGIQSMARSTYSKLLPKDTRDTASFFSFFDVAEKVALVIGLFSFGYIEEITGSMRNSAIALSFFFLLGLIFIMMVKKENPEVLRVGNNKEIKDLS